MKHPFFKSILVLGAALALMNCSEENTAAPSNDEYVTPEACWVLNADQTMLIYATGVVTDAKGNPIGVLNETQTAIVSLDGTQFIVNNVNLSTLTIIQAGETVPESNVILPASSASVITPTSSAVVTPSSSATVQPPKSSAGTTVKSSNSQQTQPKSSANVQSTMSSAQQQPKSSSSQQQGGTCFDKASGKNVKPYDNLNYNGMSYAYKEDCSLSCYYDPANNNCASLGSGSNNNQQTQPKSSANVQSTMSSAQQQPKSSSSQQQQQQQGGSLLPKIINNNKQSGYATRYWDSCKPHCAWEGKGGPVARTCNADGISKASSDASSVCDNNGNAGTCFDQTPQIVNDTIAYAFAATPGGGNDCGKCYMLTFKGTGASATNTPTDDHHRKIKGKHLIVMSSNIGYDVSHNQFDLMIPGGGPGAFNGCGKMGISCAGAQYGGFLTTCNYNKDCLIKMCNSEYKNESLRNGCLFLANWMDAANNPEVEFVQVECPAALAAKY
ncbi:MAG: hypothetical protein MJY93_07315 [Fibrobacter sp.]|nr:hypothetical protein [Fibrobacter sp.]